MAKIRDYAPLNLEAFLGKDDCVVFCTTEDEAVHFLAAMKQEFPDKCMTWNFPNVHWEKQYDEEGRAYAPYLNRDRHMKHDDLDYYVRRGFRIIPFHSLLIKDDLDDVSEQDFSEIMRYV